LSIHGKKYDKRGKIEKKGRKKAKNKNICQYMERNKTKKKK